MSRIAVIYTGLARTISDTLPNFKQNVLLGPHVDVYAVIQNDYIENLGDLIKTYMGSSLKSFEQFSPNDPSYVTCRDRLLSKMNVDQQVVNYLKNSGSIIEHYQLYLAYLSLIRHETQLGIKYKYIMRVRCDVILPHPIDFKWLDWSDDDIKQLAERIKSEKKVSDIATINAYIMSLLINPARLPYINVSENTKRCDKLVDRDYIRDGPYIVCYRCNVFYIANRQSFSLVPMLGLMYGSYFVNDPYWWNSETQFRMVCIDAQLDIYDSQTCLECKSLYEYERSNYFDKDDQLINCDQLVFFIMRTKK